MKAVFIITLLSIIFRLYIWVEFIDPQAKCCGSDQGVYHALAKNLVNTRKFVVAQNDHLIFWTDAVYGAKPPLYPVFLATIYKIFGVNVDVVKIIQVLLSALTGIIIYQIGTIIWSKKVGLVALVFFSFFWEIAYLSLNLLSENLYFFLLSFLVFILVRKKVTNLSAILIGITLALMSLTRAGALNMIILVIAWIIWQNYSLKCIRPVMLIILAFILTMAPWTLRNYRLYHHFVPVYTDGGVNVWMGFFPESEGTYHVVKTGDPEEDPVLKSLGQLKEVERDNFYYQKSIELFKKQPILEFDLMISKVLHTFDLYRQPVLSTTTTRSYWFLGRPISFAIDSFLQALISYQFSILVTLFFASIVIFWSNLLKRPAFLLLLLLTGWHLLNIALTHYEIRYVDQMYPLMILISSPLVLAIWQLRKK